MRFREKHIYLLITTLAVTTRLDWGQVGLGGLVANVESFCGKHDRTVLLESHRVFFVFTAIDEARQVFAIDKERDE